MDAFDICIRGSAGEKSYHYLFVTITVAIVVFLTRNISMTLIPDLDINCKSLFGNIPRNSIIYAIYT